MRGGRVDQAPPRILSSVFFKRLWLHGTFFARARVSDEPGTEVVPTASSVRTECAIQPALAIRRGRVSSNTLELTSTGNAKCL